MDTIVSRRDFIRAGAKLGAGAVAMSKLAKAQTVKRPGYKPIVISSGNGLRATEKAMDIIKKGGSSLDAVIAGVNIVEDDPEDTSVGYGGLPNEDGEVELDASVMHGPSARAGAVGALKFIKNPSQVARKVMERSDHIFLVGEGALKFALAHGFKKEDLLTEKSRALWLKWKESFSDRDNWLTDEQSAIIGDDDSGLLVPSKTKPDFIPSYGTINCLAIDLKGHLSGVTSTSGLAWKIAGRVGDSPIIGAGLYVDNKVGGAGATGRGEANLKICGAHTIVENMRRGLSPEEACLDALQRVVKTTKEKRLLDEKRRPKFDLTYYAISIDGQYGSATMWSGKKFALHNGKENKLYECASLYKK